MIDPILSLAHAVHSAKGVYALLLGSGVSRSAGVPTGWEVTLDLVRRVALLEGADVCGDPAAWHAARHGGAPDYSRLLNELAPTPAERRRLLHSYFEPTEEEREAGRKLPTPAHRAIARLVAGGHVRVIVTTNFDRLTEIALRDEGIEPVVISNADAAEGAAPLVHQRCVVVKLHGDYLDDRIMNTEAELGAYDPRMDAYLDRILDEFGLVVAGWSGEWDPALRRAFERCRSRRYTTWWTAVGAPGPRASSLIALREAQVVRTSGADEFFTLLHEKVASLDALATDHPLTAAAAVAALKRYLPDPRHRIRLHDLVAEEAHRVARKLAAELPVDGAKGAPQPTPEEFKRRVGVIEAATASLRGMFFHAALWSGPEHQELLLRPFSLLLPRDVRGGWKLWLDMEGYTAGLLLYSAGLGALVGRNPATLRRLLDVRYRVSGRERQVLEGLAAIDLLPHDFAQHLHSGSPRRLPVSDHLLRILSPLAADVARNPEDAFDELEVLVALAHLDALAEVPEAAVYMPPGRYVWQAEMERDHPAARLLQDADREGDAWPPLRDGFFKGGAARFAQVRAAFLTSLERVASHRLWR